MILAVPITLTVLTVVAFLVLVLCIAGEMGSPIHNDENVTRPGAVFLILFVLAIGSWIWRIWF